MDDDDEVGTSQLVIDAYEDPSTLGSVQRIGEHLREIGKPMSAKDIKNILENHPYFQRTQKPARVFMPIIGREGQYQFDVLFFSKGVKNIPLLTAVDLTTRYAYVRSIKSNSAENLGEAVKSIVLESRADHRSNDNVEPVKRFQADGEFNKPFMKAILDELSVEYYFPDVKDKATLGMIESFNMTFRRLLNQFVHIHGEAQLEKYLPLLVQNYNNSRHSRTGLKPLLTTARDRMRIRGEAFVKAGPALALLNKVSGSVRYAVRPTPVQDKFYKHGPLFSEDIKEVKDTVGYSVRLKGDESKWRPRNLLMVDEARLIPPRALDEKPLSKKTRRRARQLSGIKKELDLVDLPVGPRTLRKKAVTSYKEVEDEGDSVVGWTVRAIAGHRREKDGTLSLKVKWNKDGKAVSEMTWEGLRSFKVGKAYNRKAWKYLDGNDLLDDLKGIWG